MIARQALNMQRGMKCEDVWCEISNYLDGNLQPPVRKGMQEHFSKCTHCKTVLNGARNLKQLAADSRSFQLPKDLSRRLYEKLNAHLSEGRTLASREIDLGITNDRVTIGSHLIYFWENDLDFNRGVQFLVPGFAKREHSIAFGHDEALAKVLGVLRSDGFDPDQLINDRALTVLRRQKTAKHTLSDIGDVVTAAMKSGATAIRFLGNLGMGRDPLPGGEDDVLELESSVTSLISPLPCGVVCMYDVRTLSGRLILKGGLQTHHLAVCPDGVHENPYFQSESASPTGLSSVQ